MAAQVRVTFSAAPSTVRGALWFRSFDSLQPKLTQVTVWFVAQIIDTTLQMESAMLTSSLQRRAG